MKRMCTLPESGVRKMHVCEPAICERKYTQTGALMHSEPHTHTPRSLNVIADQAASGEMQFSAGSAAEWDEDSLA